MNYNIVQINIYGREGKNNPTIFPLLCLPCILFLNHVFWTSFAAIRIYWIEIYISDFHFGRAFCIHEGFDQAFFFHFTSIFFVTAFVWWIFQQEHGKCMICLVSNNKNTKMTSNKQMKDTLPIFLVVLLPQFYSNSYKYNIVNFTIFHSCLVVDHVWTSDSFIVKSAELELLITWLMSHDSQGRPLLTLKICRSVVVASKYCLSWILSFGNYG